MLIILLILVGLGLLVAILKTFYKPDADGNSNSGTHASSSCSTCTGSSSKCEQECMLEAAVKPIEYFDDEELDRYKGRRSDSYTEDETDEFAEVLHTMCQNEVKDWCHSLTLRGIELPDGLKDEVFMLIED